MLNKGHVLQGRYRIVSLLGQGGMGAVYRAWDTRLNIPVALKEMTPQPGLDTGTLSALRRQFEQEAQVLARLNHAHLVGVSDFFEEGGNAYLVMDFVQGESLAERIEREGALSEAEVLAWADQLLDALDYCHGQGVIHRDIKPQNVIVRPDGRAMLVDFGLVKLWNVTDPRTRTVMRGMGTPEYAPPEQYGTQPGHTDPRSDLYGLAATLYHALTGQAPLAATDRMAALAPFWSVRDLNPCVSSQMEAVVSKAMELPVPGRFGSAGEMQAALRDEVRALGREARASAGGAPAVVSPRPQPAPRRQPTKALPGAGAATQARRRAPAWMWALGGAVVVALCVGLLALWGAGQVPGVALAQPTATVAVTTTVQPVGAATRTPRATSTAAPAPTPTPEPVLAGTPVPQPLAVISPENADQVVQLARWGRGTANGVAFSPDGRLLAVASSLGVYLYDAETLEEVRFIETHAYVRGVAFSPDGATLASGSGDVRLWRVADGRLLRTLEARGGVVSVAFSPDGATLASGSFDSPVQLWRVADGRLLRTLEGHTGPVWSLAFSPDGATLASTGGSSEWSEDNTVRLWRVADGSLLRTLEGHTGGVNSVAFSPDGATLASGSDDTTVRLWRVADGSLLRALEGHTGRVTSVAFSPDGATLASGSWDNTLRLWRVSDGAPLRALEGHKSGVKSVAFSPDGATLASASWDTTLRLWRVSDGALLRTLEGHTESVNSVAFSPDGATLASGAGDGAVRLWRVSDGALLRTLEGHAGGVNSVAFSPDGATLASGSGDTTVRLWRVSDGTLLRTLEGRTGSVNSVAFSPDGATLASGVDDGTVRLWRVSDGSLLHTLQGHAGQVWSVAFSPDGTTLASGAEDGTVRLWRASDGGLLHTLEGHTGPVWSVAFSPDGMTLASGSWDTAVRLWRASDGALLRTLRGSAAPRVLGVAFSPDGALLAVGLEFDGVQLWQVSDGALLRTLEGHTEWVRSVAFSPDGATLASGSQDGTVRLWGVTGGGEATPAPAASLGDTWPRPADGMVMVYVPAGEFEMGSTEGDEQPVHTVALDSFWIDRTEVTNVQYARCVTAGACGLPLEFGSRYSNRTYADYPVTGVGWYQAEAYCAWAGARLPTEAEWEYAARGPEGRMYPWGDSAPDCGKANYGGCVGDTTAVGSYPAGASWCGALDLAGNVWEWVADWYGAYPSGRQVNPTGPSSGEYRILRGGAWADGQNDARSAYRNWLNPVRLLGGAGLRCAGGSP
jgi:WD40 repeat protein